MMSTFKTALFIWLLFLLVDHGLTVVYNAYLSPLRRRDGKDVVLPPILYVIMTVRATWHIVFAMYLIVATMKTREFIRNKYSIPEQNCAGCEDCCCSFWCSCCTIAQMARHTADYDTYRAAACTETGLPRNAPELLWCIEFQVMAKKTICLWICEQPLTMCQTYDVWYGLIDRWQPVA
jgi:Cys-rich protein (TIGR01571 family)